MVYVLLGTGFEETEAIAPIDLLRRAGVEVLTVGINGKTVFGGHGIGVEADILLGEMDLTNMDMIVLPGGLGGVASIRASKEAMDAISFAYENGRYVAAICAGPTVLTCASPTASMLPAIPAVKAAWVLPSWQKTRPASLTASSSPAHLQAALYLSVLR